ncbi:MAP/microtubule affinity-regulating kinase 3-like isoform X2 [Xyrichtys novacula]|uniref:MAP/microtubule affinity-regulating kinase 3-like isoform X2 n=1 Tax=Xyrichtys novacula TaxID=13765 RepID=A0AAV1GLL1_XYRNO|nr:MAP/microtubule affinity-regulating kinase 3-like isoform X2 [Xyrichtys novacula]
MEARMMGLDDRLWSRVVGLEQRMEGFEQRMWSRLAGLEQRMEGKMLRFELGIANRIKELEFQMEWMMGQIKLGYGENAKMPEHRPEERIKGFEPGNKERMREPVPRMEGKTAGFEPGFEEWMKEFEQRVEERMKGFEPGNKDRKKELEQRVERKKKPGIEERMEEFMERIEEKISAFEQKMQETKSLRPADSDYFSDASKKQHMTAEEAKKKSKSCYRVLMINFYKFLFFLAYSPTTARNQVHLVRPLRVRGQRSNNEVQNDEKKILLYNCHVPGDQKGGNKDDKLCSLRFTWSMRTTSTMEPGHIIQKIPNALSFPRQRQVQMDIWIIHHFQEQILLSTITTLFFSVFWRLYFVSFTVQIKKNTHLLRKHICT